MCACYQNTRNSCWQNNCCGYCNGRIGCGQNVRTTCGRTTCGCNGCGWLTTTNENTVTTNGCGWNTCGWYNRYITFPVSGTAYVPTSAIYFYPNTVGTGTTTGNNGNTTSNGNNNGTNGCGCGCCGFGRCGGARAFANYNDDYYARQYGLND